MTWQVIIRPKAEEDLQEARQWYESQRPGLSADLLDEVGRVIIRLASHPERHPVYYRGFRRILTQRFPYKIFYRAENGLVIVFRILHAKRDHRQKLP